MQEVIHLIPPEGRFFPVFFFLLYTFLFGLLVLFIMIGISAKTSRMIVTPKGMTLKTMFYGRFLPFEDLMINQARAVNLEKDQSLAPKFRTLGIGMPGYRSGWFRLKNREKALCVLTSITQVVYLPTKKDYSILVSVPEPEKVVQQLKKKKKH